jgi:uncharacterized SAM-binding protein YcdF (DUF218 family)
LFFVASKVLAFFLVPSNIIFITIFVGSALLFTPWARAGRRLVGLGAVALVILGLSPVGIVLIKALEDRFPVWNDAGPPPTGFIVLGGAVDPFGSSIRKTTMMDSAAERLTIVAELARKYPNAKIVYSGGNGALFGGLPEADYVKPLFESFGIAPDRIILERDSRTTAENAEYSKALLKPKADERWVIVTSARHMPRSIGSFRAAGFDVEALPVDWQLNGRENMTSLPPSLMTGLGLTDAAVREFVGLLAYRLSGRSPELLPAPRHH